MEICTPDFSDPPNLWSEFCSSVSNLTNKLIQNPTFDSISTLTNVYRFLRGVCAASETGPEILNILLNLLPVTVELIHNYVTFGNSEQEELLILNRVALQFLGNLVTVSPLGAKELWKKVHIPAWNGFWLRLLRFSDVKLNTYASMVFYNCFKNADFQATVFQPENVFDLCVKLMRESEQNEWHKLNATIFVTRTHVLELWWEIADDENKLTLCELTSDILECPDPEVRLHPSSVYTFGSAFAQRLQNADFQNLLSDDLSKMLLSINADISSDVVASHVLSSNENLPEIAVRILIQFRKSQLQSPSPRGFQPISSNYEVQKNLLRLISNLAYENRALQLKLGQLEAIPLVLDCTAPDSSCPFLAQWALFGLRNLCMNCPENQEILFSITSQGPQTVIDRERLLEGMGLRAELDQLSGKLKLVKFDK